MSPEILVMFKNQGSERLHAYYDALAKNLSVDLQIIISGSCFPGLLRIAISQLKYYQLFQYVTDLFKFYRKSKLQLRFDPKTSGIIEDGVDASSFFIRLSRVNRTLSTWIYYAVWLTNAFNVKKILHGYKDCLLIVPDELYGFAAIIKFNSAPSNTWICNTSSTDLYCNIINYDSPHQYKYLCRTNFPVLPIFESHDLISKVDQLYSSVFDNLIDHRDYSLAYADYKPPFSPDYPEKRKKILVAAHIFKDAPNSHESGFHGFKHWLYEVLSALKSHQDKCVIYLKEHPSIDIYSEQGVLEGFLNTLQLNYPVTFISSKYATKLDDYDLVLTCSGSICYECAYLGVPVMSCSRSFSSKLSNVIESLSSEDLRSNLNLFLNNPTHKICDTELTSYQYKILAQHLIYRNIANTGLSIGDAKMHAMIQVKEVDIDAIAEKFLKALQGFYEQRNKPGVTLLSADLSRIEVLECQG